MDHIRKIILAFELHAVEEIRECFENGISPNQIHQGKPLIYELINMYTRGPSFKHCIRAFVDYGLEFEDPVLLSVLLNDSEKLERLIGSGANVLSKKYTLNCTFTPLFEASLLHICAEYNHLACAKVLVRHGAEVNSKAGMDSNGFGGQTPIFHTVNQDANKSWEVLKFLISQQADLKHTVKGLVWGKGYDWETFIPSVNPISYAMMGLLRQFQRTEKDTYEVVSVLMQAAYGVDYLPSNIPNKYLAG